MHTRSRFWLLALAILLPMTGCGKSPVEPSFTPQPAAPMAVPAPTAAPQGLFAVITSVSGPDNCFAERARAQIGVQTKPDLYQVNTLGGIQLGVLSPAWTDWVNLSGPVAADGSFTASAKVPQLVCGNTSQPASADAVALGTITQDGDATILKLSDTWVYHTREGDVTVVRTWKAP